MQELARFDLKKKITALKMSQWRMDLGQSNYFCYLQTLLLFVCTARCQVHTIPLYKVLQNTFQWEAIVSLREKQPSKMKLEGKNQLKQLSHCKQAQAASMKNYLMSGEKSREGLQKGYEYKRKKIKIKVNGSVIENMQ